MRAFITGTDTDVGKTYVTCLLLKALREAGHRAAGFKPICCGDRDDCTALQAAGDPSLTVDNINPVWLRTPAAPYAASMIENRPINLDHIDRAYAQLDQSMDAVLVEGAGGWEVPITRDFMVADLARRLELPVLLVVNNRLGALNHSILTAKAIAQKGLTCAGLLLNHVQIERHSATITNRGILEDVLELPILAEITHGETEITDFDWNSVQ
ncbi:MAG: dethiobiotin synthetase [Verrucomicrobiales bacterium]|jgi:dethiobiotin synthetase